VPDTPDGDPGVRYKQAAQIFDFDPAQHLDSGIISATNRNTHLPSSLRDRLRLRLSF